MAAAKIGIGDDEAVIAALALYDRAGNLLYLSPDRVVSKRHVIGGPGSEFSYYTTEKSVDFRLELPVLQPEMQLTVRLLFAIKELGLTEAQYGYIMGVSALISVGFVLATGYVLDRVSPLYFCVGSSVHHSRNRRSAPGLPAVAQAGRGNRKLRPAGIVTVTPCRVSQSRHRLPCRRPCRGSAKIGRDAADPGSLPM